MEVLISILVTVWSILCIILFFKVWGMCNNVLEIKNILKMNMKTDQISITTRDVEKQDSFYNNSKMFAIYKPENLKVEILEKDDDDVYKCRSTKDGQIYYFIKDVLEFL